MPSFDKNVEKSGIAGIVEQIENENRKNAIDHEIIGAHGSFTRGVDIYQ